MARPEQIPLQKMQVITVLVDIGRLRQCIYSTFRTVEIHRAKGSAFAIVDMPFHVGLLKKSESNLVKVGKNYVFSAFSYTP
jgi:hypothetical protein